MKNKLVLSFLFLLMSVLLLNVSRVNPQAGQSPSPLNKINYLVIQTIEKLKADGITAKNASTMNVAEKYNSAVSRFDPAGRLGIYLHAENITPAFISKLRELGGDVVLNLEHIGLVAVYMPIDKIESTADLAEVLMVRPITGGGINAGSVTTEGDSVHKADVVRTDLNVTGDSINVGVISDGCASWGNSQAAGDLPAGFGAGNYTFNNGNKIGAGDEGTAMLEIVYDLAPDADLYFYGALYDPAGSAAHVDAIYRLVREKGCDIIVDDLYWYDQPMFEDGTVPTNWTIAAAVKWAIDTGVVYISAAGNWANGPPNFITRSHYQDVYTDIHPAFGPVRPLPAPLPLPLPAHIVDLHDFNPNPLTTDIALTIVVFPNDPHPTVNIILEWNDQWGVPPNDFDLYLYDKNFNIMRGSSINMQPGAPPWEMISHVNNYPTPETLQIVINRFSAAAPSSLLGLYIDGDNWAEYFMPQNSIWGQMGVPGAIAVGAVPHNNITSIEPFSSNGNYDVYFPAYQSRPKPDLVAVDGVQVNGGGGFPPPFFGTSAAAPHMAGLTALLLSGSPAMTPAQVQAKFARTAIDMGAVGFDPVFGNGFIDIERTLLELNLTQDISSGPYTHNNSTNVPMFFTRPDGYAVNTITVTGGLVQPLSVSSTVSVTSGNPYDDAGVVDLGCPTVKRWYNLSQSGGGSGNYDATITAYIDETERQAAGINAGDLHILHWNGSFFKIIPQSMIEPPTLVGNTWKVKGVYNNADLSPFFVGYLTRSLDVSTLSNGSAQPDSTAVVKYILHNTGNGWDTLKFSVYDTRGWVLAPEDSSLSITSGTQETVEISAVIPAGEAVGTIDTLWLIASYISDTTFIDSSFATVEVSSGKTTISCSMMEGWNMVSVPVIVDDSLKITLYPTAVSDAFTFKGSYVQEDTIRDCVGYWIKFDSTDTIDITGIDDAVDVTPVVLGWNMIGSLTQPIDVDSVQKDPSDMVISGFFGYDGIYTEADTLQPGKAYWVKTDKAGNLIIK
jgi:hypothetical protein